MKAKKTRVVAYARVSTMEQVNDGNSLENQRTYFQRELSKNKDFTLVSLPSNDNGIYADKGISGTKLKRPAFMSMLKDAGLRLITSTYTDKESDAYEIVGQPKFDVIFVKDTSRFARNVSVDSLLKTLTKNGVAVYFLDIGKRSDSNEDMTFIQIFFTFSERDSRDKSFKTRFGHQEAHRRGDIATGGKMYGYNYVRKKKNDPYHSNYFTIDEAEAEIVRKVFNYYTEDGYGDYRICQLLKDEGFTNRAGKKFTTNTIARMLRNEKYTGVNDAGKYDYGKDIFTKKLSIVPYEDINRQMARNATQRLKEEGVIDRIPQIISVEQFQKAQQIRQSHCDALNIQKCVYNGTTPYAKKIICDKCGSHYISIARKTVGSVRYRLFGCMHRTRYDNDLVPRCTSPTVKEQDLDALLESKLYVTKKLEDFEDLLGAIEICIQTLNEAKNTPKEEHVKQLSLQRDELQEKKNKLLPLYLEGHFTKEQLDFYVTDIDNQITVLNKQITIDSKDNSDIDSNIEYLQSLQKQIEDVYKEEYTHADNVKIDDKEFMSLPIKEHQRQMDLRRRKKLRDVKAIHVDMFGNLSIEFMVSDDIQQIIDYIDNLKKLYSKK